VSDAANPYQSGFVTLVGRPNVGKSTLLNQLIGAKVAITSDRPQTTRSAIRGVRTTDETQIVFLDTPGLHRPRTALGERTNARALGTLSEVDTVCLIVEANAPYGPGDRFVADRVRESGTPAILVVNKIDVARREQVVAHLGEAEASLGQFEAIVPCSARTGEGLDELVGALEARLAEGPQYYPDGMITDQPEHVLAAELVREQLLGTARDELPHSIAVTVEELEPDGGTHAPDLLRLRAIVRVERDSQKGIVIGKGGGVLRDAGAGARRELEALLGRPVYLETTVRVDRDWQRRDRSLDRLGF
jgi:GTP-binding protein Era